MYKVLLVNGIFNSKLYSTGSSQKKIKEGVVLRSRDTCGFSDHIKYILPQKGGLPPISLDPCMFRGIALPIMIV